MASDALRSCDVERRLSLQPGAYVIIEGQRFRRTQALDLETVLVEDVETGQARQAKIQELQPEGLSPQTPVKAERVELVEITDHEWQQAHERFEIIRPLLDDPDWTRAKVRTRAEAAGRHPATLYRWLEQYQRGGRVSTLVPTKRGMERGQSRLAPDVEAVLSATIDEVYLTTQKRSVSYTCNEVARRCRNAGLALPHASTIRRRIKALSMQETLRRREGSQAVRNKYAPMQGTFPGANWPLAMVQIDHTPVDLILVDDVHRRPVGRPWITVAIDVFSRMVAGCYVSFDPPGTLAVGLCLAHAILPKESWLAKHEITTPWPVWGVMDSVHADHAKECRGPMLRMACQAYGITLHWRPVARPHFGGHIARLLGTLHHEIHNLPGRTFSTPQARGTYDAEQHAAMTLSEFERWVSMTVVEVSHQRLHSALGTTPLQKYEEGICGTAERPGRGLPDRFIEERRLRLAFMSYQARTVQRHGLVIDEIQYYDEVLKPWVNAADPSDATGKRKRKFIVRRDPRDISRVYFYDPELKQYFEIPYRNTAYPPMSVWELRDVRRRLKAEGQKALNAVRIFDAYNRLRALEAAAVVATKKARRAAQRRRGRAEVEPPRPEGLTLGPDAPLASADAIQPFDEIEELDGEGKTPKSRCSRGA
jgi:putative transposase